MPAKRILVTGGTGFIGSKLVERLAGKGHILVVFDNNFRGSKERLKSLDGKIEIIEKDIRDGNEVRKAVRQCQAIFHLASINGTRFFYEKPDLVLEVGVKGILNALEAALENQVEEFYLASSSEVYHQPSHIPTTEAEHLLIPDVKNPRYSYAGGKIISELLVLNYFRTTPVRHCIFRPHNVFGPGMGFEHVVPELMKKIYLATEGWGKKVCRITIQGTGAESRAFCFIDEAINQIMVIFENGESGEIYNIGVDEEKTIMELIEDIGRLLDVQIHVIPGELRAGGTSRRCPSLEKLRSLGYKGKNRYQEGLEKTVAWYKNYFQTQGAR